MIFIFVYLPMIREIPADLWPPLCSIHKQLCIFLCVCSRWHGFLGFFLNSEIPCSGLYLLLAVSAAFSLPSVFPSPLLPLFLCPGLTCIQPVLLPHSFVSCVLNWIHLSSDCFAPFKLLCLICLLSKLILYFQCLLQS